MSDSEIFFQNSESTSLTFTGAELKIKENSGFSGYGVRVLDDKKVGFSYCQEETELDPTIEKAKKISKFSPESDFSFAPKASYENLDIFDSSLDPSDFSNLKDLLYQAKESAESFGARSKIILSASKSHQKLHNSAGFSGEYDDTGFSMYVECMHGDGLGVSYFSSNKLPKDVSETGLKAAGLAKDMQGAKKPPAGKYPVVVQIEALDSLLDVLLPSFSGDWKRRGITNLPKQKFSEIFTLSEDGRAGGTSARPFDDEGTVSKKHYLVNQGKVETYLYDREIAALAKTDKCGFCSRNSYDDNPSIGPSNLIISPGDWKDLGEIDRYIELHSAHGSHTANITTGDIGLEVSSAFLVEGEKRTPLKGFMITGNVFEMFANIEAIESKQRTLGSLIAPRIAFSDLRIVS